MQYNFTLQLEPALVYDRYMTVNETGPPGTSTLLLNYVDHIYGMQGEDRELNKAVKCF